MPPKYTSAPSNWRAEFKTYLYPTRLARIPRFAALTLTTALIACCASQDIHVEESTFRTRIAQSGLKHFEVSIGHPKVRARNNDSQEGMQGRPRERRVDPDKVKKLLSAYAKANIDINKYCRNDFWVIEVNAYGPAMSMRGECNDSATDADRTKFPDTITQW